MDLSYYMGDNIYSCVQRVITMKKITILSTILALTVTPYFDAVGKSAKNPQVKVVKKEEGLLEKIKSEFVSKKKEFEKEQKKQESKDNKPKQEIIPTVVVFGSKENAASIDNDLNKLELNLHQMEESLQKLSQKISDKVKELIVDDDIKAEECKSRMVADVINRIYFYIRSINQAVKLVHTGVAILTSINSIKDESYSVGCDNIIKGLIMFSFTETLAKNIESEIGLLKPCMHPRHQQILADPLKEYVPNILALTEKIRNWDTTYEKEVCQKIVRDDLKKIFKGQIKAVKASARSTEFFANLLKALQKYYTDAKSVFKIEKSKK